MASDKDGVSCSVSCVGCGRTSSGCDSPRSGDGGLLFECLQSSLTLSTRACASDHPEGAGLLGSCDSTPRLCEPSHTLACRSEEEGHDGGAHSLCDGTGNEEPSAAAAAAAAELAAAAAAAAGSVCVRSWDVALHLPLWISSNERIQIEERLEGWVDELFRVVGPEVEALSQVCALSGDLNCVSWGWFSAFKGQVFYWFKGRSFSAQE